MTRPPLLKRLLDGRRLTIGVPFVWLFLFFLLPFLIVLKISFSLADVAIPPYTELFSYADQQLDIALNFGNYLMFADDPLLFKKLVYEMRFDEVSARYAEFGPFYVGERMLPDDLTRWLG